MVTDSNQTYHGDHFEIYRDSKSLLCIPGPNGGIAGQLYFKIKETNKTHRKKGLVATINGSGEVELDEGGLKL